MVSKSNIMMFWDDPVDLGEGGFPTPKLKVDHFRVQEVAWCLIHSITFTRVIISMFVNQDEVLACVFSHKDYKELLRMMLMVWMMNELIFESKKGVP